MRPAGAGDSAAERRRGRHRGGLAQLGCLQFRLGHCAEATALAAETLTQLASHPDLVDCLYRGCRAQLALRARPDYHSLSFDNNGVDGLYYDGAQRRGQFRPVSRSVWRVPIRAIRGRIR